MRVLVPYDETDPKTRLASLFSPTERREFSRLMLGDVLASIRRTGRTPVVLATAPLDVDASVVVDDRPLSAAVNAHLEPNTAVVMADLALATPAALSRLFSAEGEVVVAPGIGGGTNALVSRHPEFSVDYHGASFRDHREIARRIGAEWAVLDSYRLATDVDERVDLAELLLHGDGAAREWLVDAGIRLDTGQGRVGVCRE
ncbi:2-phospho-L-lactate guanylyltransferase [Haladaptatus sp. GCM10025707]|uniref:2-phospho-L-lactate guanylyltransferase n=1 Tax=unclassified Haladaptatus TaxID=2622732 RepID=UPI0023E866F9|nr:MULTISPECIES: 2-phospho-L-lactate guanylyltransferase [unclassified Haladaptatus]